MGLLTQAWLLLLYSNDRGGSAARKGSMPLLPPFIFLLPFPPCLLPPAPSSRIPGANRRGKGARHRARPTQDPHRSRARHGVQHYCLGCAQSLLVGFCRPNSAMTSVV